MDTVAHMYYLQLPIGGPMQGDIWSRLPAGPLGDEECDGVIITPRCDFAHSKSPVLNFLPILSLENYLVKIACFGLLRNSLSDAYETARKKAKPIEIENLLELGVPIKQTLTIAAKIREGWDSIQQKKKKKPTLSLRGFASALS